MRALACQFVVVEDYEPKEGPPHGSLENARLTPHGRLLLCERIELHGWKLSEAAAAAGVSRQTAGKWLARSRAEATAGLTDRSSQPLRIALRVVGRLLRRVTLLRLTRRRGPA